MRARQSQRRLLPSAHDSSAYRRAAGILRDGGGAWACSKGMHLSESVPQDLMCLRSRCVAVRWIQPSDLHVTIEDCSSPSAEPPVPATVHWRQRAAFTSRTRDRQSSYNPQLCCARALETWFGDLSATTRRLALRREVRARPAPREGTRPFFSEIGEITLIARRSRFPPSPAP